MQHDTLFDFHFSAELKTNIALFFHFKFIVGFLFCDFIAHVQKVFLFLMICSTNW